MLRRVAWLHYLTVGMPAMEILASSLFHYELVGTPCQIYVARLLMVKREMWQVVCLLVTGGDALDEGMRNGCRHRHVDWQQLSVEAAARRGFPRPYELTLVTSFLGLSRMIRFVGERVKVFASYTMRD